MSRTGLHVVGVYRFTILAKSIGVVVCSICAQSTKEVMVGGKGPVRWVTRGWAF